MEMNLRAESPLCSRGRPALVVRPAAAATGLALSVVRCSRFTRGGLVRCMVSSSDYPKRNPRRASTSKSKGVASGGYASRPTAESSTKKIEQSRNNEGDFSRANGSLYGEAAEQASTAEESSQVYMTGDILSGAERDGAGTEEEADQNQSSALPSASMDDDSIDRQLDEYRGKISALVSSKPEPSSLASVAGQNESVGGFHGQHEPITGSEEHGSSIVDAPTKGRLFAEAVVGHKDFTESAAGKASSENEEGQAVSLEDDVGISTDADEELPVSEDDPEVLLRRLQELADENYSTGNNCFVFPEVVKADSMIDLYLNRSMSALASESDVFVKGAFNGWRWNRFTETMHRSELRGDWWCCKLYIPKQAYRLDFVFFNGDTVYENNNHNDFFLEIESDIDEHSFEDFLVEEKRKELERLAAEEAERKRQAEERHRREEERAAMEADRAQARSEVEMKKEKLRQMLSSASRYAENLWYIEPNTYRGGDRVRLYYNRSSRSLMHNTEIWMHGGYNNWIDGLSIAERLVKSHEKEGDWWYVEG
ncbi:Starch synthase IIIb-1 [Zea mays]|nr:Starch synthase IIIb-1 [Zea mays]